jgi:hypothetical protein
MKKKYSKNVQSCSTNIERVRSARLYMYIYVLCKIAFMQRMPRARIVYLRCNKYSMIIQRYKLMSTRSDCNSLHVRVCCNGNLGIQPRWLNYQSSFYFEYFYNGEYFWDDVWKTHIAMLHGRVINRELRHPYWSTCGSGKAIIIITVNEHKHVSWSPSTTAFRTLFIGRVQDAWLAWSRNNLHRGSTCYLVISGVAISRDFEGIVVPLSRYVYILFLNLLTHLYNEFVILML